MKIRTDFVTNSSSSSYICAFKGLPILDDETLTKYPFLRQYEKIVKQTLYDSRGPFITNSNRGYICAFKGLPLLDDETLTKYPFLRQYETIVKQALYYSDEIYNTDETIECATLVELQDCLLREYSWMDENKDFGVFCTENPHVKEIYDQCVSYMKNGYKILFKDIGYSDYRETLFHEIEGEDFVIINTGES